MSSYLILSIFEIICACSVQTQFALIMFCSPDCKVRTLLLLMYLCFFKFYGATVTGHSPASSCPHENRAAPVQVKKDALIMFCTPVPKVQTLLAFWADVC